jgi:GNAT superfamily N-acetyltransferase
LDIVFITTKYLPLFEGILPSDVLARAKMKNQSQVLLGAICENCACGVLAAHISGETLVLSHIYVLEEKRKQGIATELILRLLEIAKDNATLQDLRYTFLPEEPVFHDDLLARFLIGMGFSVTHINDRQYCVNIKKLAQNPFWEKSIKLSDNEHEKQGKIIALSSLPVLARRSFETKLAGIPSAPPALPDAILPELSMTYYHEKQIQGIAIIEAGQSDTLNLSWVYMKDSVSRAVLPLLLKKVFAAVYATLPNADVNITTVTDISQRLVEKLCPDAEFKLLAKADFDLGDIRDEENINIVYEYLLEITKEQTVAQTKEQVKDK